ncbi:S24 family peptidase [Arcobacter lacus]|uniref:S24 family peptidase n=1 Tax=Arcobacter lacus TaxID=1912876 RepID=UPI0021BBB2D0|nr:S24 family peptidase [Arcobacter lacus]MCT7908444.1 S24 family peptidase [Arcobacter lacus]
MQIQDILDRIKQKFMQTEDKAYSEKDISIALGFHPTYIAVTKSRDSIPYENIIKLCQEKNWSLDEILLGKVPHNITQNIDDDSVYLVDYLEDTFASCGAGGESYESKRKIKIDKTFIDALKPSGMSYNIEAIRASGDSMEPTIADGSIVIIDKNDTNFSRSGIFVLRTEAGLLIKRLSRNINGDVSVVSDNSVYHIDVIKANNLTVFGKVLGVVRKV